MYTNCMTVRYRPSKLNFIIEMSAHLESSECALHQVAQSQSFLHNTPVHKNNLPQFHMLEERIRYSCNLLNRISRDLISGCRTTFSLHCKSNPEPQSSLFMS